MHACLHSEEEERNLFILGPLMSLCVFLLTQRPVHGEQTCHEGISAITRRRYWYRCINRQTDSRYAPINPSLQNEVSVLTNVKANEGTQNVNKEQAGWAACESGKYEGEP